MARLRLLALLFPCAGLVFGCADDGSDPHRAADASAVSVGGLDGGTPLPADCAPLGSDAPQRLACTGLYGASGTIEKSVPAAVRPFTPGSPLWSDGAEKQRWVQLPEGSTIDTSKPGVWSFPNGTRAWKEFRHNGKRIETRFFMKLGPGIWRTATYLWNASETEATNFAGGDVPVDDGTYHVPTGEECEQCHRGSRDQLLGFEPLLLGLAGAQGLTLETLIDEHKLSHPPAQTSYQIPDDGTGVGPQVLAWLHVNCGVGCHNTNENSYGYPSRLFLRLNPEMLAVGGPSTWDPIKTTLNQMARTANFAGATRIVPGSPEQSLLLELARTRGSSRAMPPIATRLIDQPNVDLLREWIVRLGGASDAGMDAGAVTDAAVLDAGPGDNTVPDTGVDAAPITHDAELADAGTVEEPDAAVVEESDTGVVEVPDTGVVEVPDTGVVEVPDTGVVEVPVEEPDAGVVSEEPDTGVVVEVPVEEPDAGVVVEVPSEVPDAGSVVEVPPADVVDPVVPPAELPTSPVEPDPSVTP